MVQQSRNTWQQTAAEASRSAQSATSSGAPSVTSWMQDVLGKQKSRAPSDAPSQEYAAPADLGSPPRDHAPAGHDLQSRLAAIAKNIEKLESRVAGAPVQQEIPGAQAAYDAQQDAIAQGGSPDLGGTWTTAPMEDNPYGTAAQVDAQAPAALDPIEALRRRKRELDAGSGASSDAAPEQHVSGSHPAHGAVFEDVSHAGSQQHATPPALESHDPHAAAAFSPPADDYSYANRSDFAEPPALAPNPPRIDTEVVNLFADRIDEQFGRLHAAVEDVRSLARRSAEEQAGLQQQVVAIEHRLSDPGPSGEENPPAALADLREQVIQVQAAITSLPTGDAIRSLEDGYRHVLERLDSLKDNASSEEKVDALYQEVSGLREAIDAIGATGTDALLGEMRDMVARLEQTPNADPGQISAALEQVSSLAQGMGPEALNEAIGAVVERLVALEARIDALPVASEQSAMNDKLDALQSEMGRFDRFQDEIVGLGSALEAIRAEVRDVSPQLDLSSFDARFSALDRIEEVTGGYGAQIRDLGERMNALDGNIAQQSEIVRQVAALSRQIDTFTNTIPVREIEQALLDLTGRVTALQEDGSSGALMQAVQQLGARVEACIETIPSTDTMVGAVAERLDPTLLGIREQVDNVYRTITSDDWPIIDRIAARIEALVKAMPANRAEDALANLEGQLVALNERYEQVGVISRDEVMELSGELARVRAGVELGTNNDLQQALLDQIQQLADRFEDARAMGNASLLPKIEQQIEELASQLRSLGGSAGPGSDMGAFARTVDSQLQQHLGQFRSEFQQPAPIPTAVPDEGVRQLSEEFGALRKQAEEQDKRVHDTLVSVQSALEKMVSRIEHLESDDKAALALAQEASMPAPPVERPAFEAPPAVPSPAPQPFEDDPAPTEAEPAPAPGDAQDLLRQLSGAMDTPEMPAAAPGPEVELPRSQARRARKAEREAGRRGSDGEQSAAQRASFIAAARRAAQAAALEASSGADPNSVQGQDAAARLDALKGKADGDVSPDAKVEPSAGPFDMNGDTSGDGTAKGPHNPDANDPIQEEQHTPQAESTPKQKHKKKAPEATKHDGSGGFFSSGTMLAGGMFLVGLVLFAASLILGPDNEPPVIAPIGEVSNANPAATEESDVRVVGEPAEEVGDVQAESGENGSDQLAGDEAADEQPAAAQPDAAEAPASDGMTDATEDETSADLSQESLSGDVLDGGFSPANAVPSDTIAPSDEAAGTDADQDALEEGFDQASAAPANDGQAPDAEPANLQEIQGADIGPISGLTTPAIPPFSAGSLPEAIGSPRLRVAAAGGDPQAQFEVATRYTEGRFVPQDFAAAAHWYGLAAEQGLAPAAYRLGTFYEQGRGIDRDAEAAIAWYERAAEAGNPRAMHNLAVMAAEGRYPSSVAEGPDFQRAGQWFEAAANRGLSDSQFNLAVLFARGMGVERDLTRSYQWFALAANAGDTEAVARRDEVASVLGEEALALARARVDSWEGTPVPAASVMVPQPEGGWDDGPVRAGSGASDADLARAAISEAQTLLAQRGFDPGPADGLIGPRTLDAVRAFRDAAGLDAGSTIDAELINALRSADTI
ncbi:MAG: peptidoglycan-binding protein [Pseudomonadota bacterium]